MVGLFNLSRIPALPKRNNNLERFSMYIVLNSDTSRLLLQWKPQTYLQKNMKLYEKMHPCFPEILSNEQDKELKLLNFWLNLALHEPQPIQDWEPANKERLVWEHLASYLEEKCYWAAKNLCGEYEEHSWEEYFYQARLMVNNKLKFREILAKYNSQQSKMDTYIIEVLEKNIKYKAQVKRFSRWRQLCKSSNKELKEALQISGLSELETSQYLFATKYFKQVYLAKKINHPNRRIGTRWTEPEQEDFEEMSQLYNAERKLPSAPHEIFINSTNITAKQIKAWMENCITALKNYPKSIVPHFYIDRLQIPDSQSSSQISDDNFQFDLQSSLAAKKGEKEQQYLVQKTSLALLKKLETIKPEEQKFLSLYYGFGLTQQQISVRANINQSTISRLLAKSKNQLIKTLVDISQPQEWVEPYVAGWLERNYSAPVKSDLIQVALGAAIKKIEAKEREILQLYYGQHENEITIAHLLGMSQAEVKARLNNTKHLLKENLIKEINIWMKEYLRKWLSKHYQENDQMPSSTLSNQAA